MIVNVDREDLTAAVRAAARACPRGTTIEILKHVLLRAEPHGLDVCASDTEVGVTRRVDGSITSEDGPSRLCVLPGDLLDALEGSDTGTVNVGFSDRCLVVRSGTSERILARTRDGDDMPIVPRPNRDRASVLIPGLAGMIEDATPTMGGVSKKNGDVLAWSFLEVDEHGPRLVSTDGFLMTVTSAEMTAWDGEDIDVRVPNRALTTWRMIAGGGHAVVTMEGTRLFLSDTDRTFSVATVTDDRSVNWERVIPREKSGIPYFSGVAGDLTNMLMQGDDEHVRLTPAHLDPVTLNRKRLLRITKAAKKKTRIEIALHDNGDDTRRVSVTPERDSHRTVWWMAPSGEERKS